MLSPDLLEILRCPRCHGTVTPLDNPQGLHCGRCALLYPILDGIPSMLLEEARPLPAPAPPAE